MNISLQGLVVLLLFVAPGFLYSRAYLAARPRYGRAPELFQQTVLAVVGSALIHAFLISLVAVGILSYVAFTRDNPVVQEFFRVPTTVMDAPIAGVATYLLIAAIYVALSLVLARQAGARLGRLFPEHVPRWYRFVSGGDPPEQVLLWYTTLVEEPIRLGITTPRVVAWLRSGERFEGDEIGERDELAGRVGAHVDQFEVPGGPLVVVFGLELDVVLLALMDVGRHPARTHQRLQGTSDFPYRDPEISGAVGVDEDLDLWFGRGVVRIHRSQAGVVGGP